MPVRAESTVWPAYRHTQIHAQESDAVWYVNIESINVGSLLGLSGGFQSSHYQLLREQGSCWRILVHELQN